MKLRLLALLLCLLLLLTGCGKKKGEAEGNDGSGTQGAAAELGDADKSFGAPVEELGAYDGYFEEECTDITVSCLSGTENAYRLEGNTLYFTALTEDSTYALSGRLRGNVVIDVGDDVRLELELHGFSLVSETVNPMMVISAEQVTVKAKKDTANYLYDKRGAIDKTDETLYAGAIHSAADLELCGKGSLTVVSENLNGIHSKGNLEVRNLSLFVSCVDNALKGNDGVRILGGTTTLIATGGDGIKTASSAVSKKGNQRGTVSVSGGTHSIYAARDGIDAAYDAIIEDSSTVLRIYTARYSNYSVGTDATVSSSDYYIRFTDNAYRYSVQYFNSESDFVWVNATYHSAVQGDRSTYYYYSFPKNTAYGKMKLYIYSSDMEQGQDGEYLICSDFLALNTAHDTFALTERGGRLSYAWTDYSTNIREEGFGGPGGMNDGNTEKGNYSTKGIKAANEIVIRDGTVSIKSYDDAIHANSDGELENGTAPLGNVTVSGGDVTVYTNDDGLHADGTVEISAGTVRVLASYEGIEGARVLLSGGCISVQARDDGINATATEGTGVTISGGSIYLCCSGDGIDANSRTAYSGIVFSGGNTVVLSDSNGNSALDTEQGYTYTGGIVVAVMPRGGMSNEATHCRNFSSVGKTAGLSLSSGNYLVATVGNCTATVQMPFSLSALVILLGDTSAKAAVKTTVSAVLDENGVAWNEK